MLNEFVLAEINQFEHHIQLKLAAEKVADRLNSTTNRLKLIAELKLINAVIEPDGSQPIQMTAMAVGAAKQSISDGLITLRESVDQLQVAKLNLHDFLFTRLNGLMLPSDKDSQLLQGTLLSQISLASPLTCDLILLSNNVRSVTSDIQYMKAEIEARLLT